MKKKINWNTITVTVLVVLGLVLGIKITRGIIVQHEEKIKQHEELVSLVKEETPKIKRYVHKQDQRHAIKTITIEYQKTHLTPMNFIEIEGYINGNKELGFEVDADARTEGVKMYIDGFECSKKMGKLIGFE
ncbi:DUF1433 domain-containing protein [Ligilactobacillus sp. LYQ139]|uniref:DUF1433 domain-containing protein n=1 Tax=Ligilactobacillus sp. LYQ139 TaxID=3378800 RepID=UPI0038543739